MGDPSEGYSGLAAMNPKSYGVVPVDQALQSRGSQKSPEISKFKDLLNAIHDAAYPAGSPDEQTELQWENIEGEVMGEILAHSLISGTPYMKINHPFFSFATPESCIEKTFADSLVKAIKNKHYIIPSISAMKENLNRLMISFNRQGRGEQVKMLQALSISLQEQERTDPSGLGRLRKL